MAIAAFDHDRNGKRHCGFRIRALMRRTVLCISLAISGSPPALAQSGTSPDLLTLANEFVLTPETRPRDDRSNRFALQQDAVDFGEALFFDTALSADAVTACATCHVTAGAFVPNESRRAGPERGFRTVLPVSGAAWQVFFNWDGGKDSLWSQALGPLEHPDEHNLTRTEVAAYVLQNYPDEIKTLDPELLTESATIAKLAPASPAGTRVQRDAWRALPADMQTRVNRLFALTGKAIAAFLAALPPPVSEWDRLVEKAAGDPTQMPEDVLRGFSVFSGKGRCSTCHSGPMFSDGDFHNTGLPAHEGQPVDMGRQAVLRRLIRDEFNCLGPYSDASASDCKDLTYMAQSMERALGTFRTPTLRGVSQRGPFGHAGQIDTLAEMVNHYDTAPPGPHGRMIGVSTMSELVPLGLSDQEKADLLAFLKTL